MSRTFNAHSLDLSRYVGALPVGSVDKTNGRVRQRTPTYERSVLAKTGLSRGRALGRARGILASLAGI